MPKYFLIFFLFLLPYFCIAREPDSTEYYRTYEDKFNIQLLFKTRPTHLQLADEESRILFRPNSRPQIGIGGSVVNIGFALYVRIPESIGREPSTFGETDYTDFQFNYYRSHFALTLHYLKYSGFYVSNATDFDTPSSVPRYPLSEDVTLEGGSLLGLYLLDAEQLSFRAPYNNSDRQMVGAGSFLAMTEISHYVLGSDSLVVPEGFLDFFDSSSDLQGGSFASFSLMPGYTRTFVADEFYLNLTLAAGPGIQYNSFHTSDESAKNWHVAAKINGQAAIGFDNDKLFSSITLAASRRRFGTEQLIIGNDTANIVFTVGHRFQEFNWMNLLRKSELYERVMNPLSNF